MNKVWKYTAGAFGIAAISVVASVATIAAIGHYQGQSFLSDGIENEYGFKQTSYVPTSGASAGLPNLVDAAEASVNAVVHIKVEAEQRMDSQQYFDPFEFFFGGDSRSFQRPQTRQVVGYGSGVIISTDGYIITNNHVVKGAKDLTVILNDNRSFKAKVVGTDATTDIALLKVDAKGLPTIPFGDSDKLRVGEWVLAVGNPFNLTSTVTAGIVSAKGRSTQQATGSGTLQIESFIQTDAAVNAGNSGGALVNDRGELIGINTMIYSQTGNYSGYSFAVPISIAAKVVADIKQYGTVQRAVLGITGGDITEAAVKEFDLKVREGALVADFAEVSAAVSAGMQKGDVVTAVDDKQIKSFPQLQEAIGRYRPGDKVKLTVNRKGAIKELTVTLKNNEGSTSVITGQSSENILGATFQELSTEQKRTYGVSYGVEISSVGTGRFREAGIKKGFIILSVNRQPVNSGSDISDIVNETRQSRTGRAILVRGFYPDGNIRTFEIEL
ncbi:DegQ family serine endoprotease [Porphyromonas loveana]|uniref:DegQ family serine endoprotease n=1 Tax=Porphyromonas loveana TaxID=1884669 RepID=UPI0035A112E5